MINGCDNSETCLVESIVHTENKRSFVTNSDYKIDLWREFIKRWMVAGVFLVVILAVLGPKIGAPGGNYTACSIIAHFRTHCTPFGHVINTF